MRWQEHTRSFLEWCFDEFAWGMVVREESLQALGLPEATICEATHQRGRGQGNSQGQGSQKGLTCLGDVAQQPSGSLWVKSSEEQQRLGVFHSSGAPLTYD